MDSITQTLLNPGQEKLGYITINGSESVILGAEQESVKNLAAATNDCSFAESYKDDEGRTKLRKRNPENWKQNVRKRNKNQGVSI